ncbi:MAG TPA: hypothetical protein PK813_12860 [Candidatus Hydrogenedens sp.]|nr:hypothetical protein [Candidatus Hydrogenedens sp.]
MKYNAIEKLIAENNGILKTADVVAAGISQALLRISRKKNIRTPRTIKDCR